MERSTVHVIDDQEAIRTLVVQALELVSLDCIPWSRPREFLSEILKSRIDVVIVDIRLEGMSGLELVRQIREKGVTAPVIFISGINEVPVTVEAMKLGAHDFLPKPFTAQALIESVQSALLRYKAQLERDRHVEHARHLLAKLSPREQQVLLAIVDGKANKVMAAELGLSEKTIEEHRKHLMMKLSAGSVADVIKLAVLGGLCDP